MKIKISRGLPRIDGTEVTHAIKVGKVFYVSEELFNTIRRVKVLKDLK